MESLDGRTKLMSAPQHEQGISKNHDADRVEDIERAQHSGIGLDEFPYEPLPSIPAYEQIEPLGTEEFRAARDPREIDDQEQRHRGALVKLHGMSQRSVAEIHAPGQAGGRAIGE